MTKRSRRFCFWRACLLLLAVLLTACNQVSVEQSNQPGQLQGKLLIWYPLQGELATIFLNDLKEFQQLNPSIEIVSEYIPSNELSSRFINQSQHALGASIIIDSARQIPVLLEARRIQPINEDAIDFSTYFAPTLIQVRYQDKIYGVPLGSKIRVLCYNQAKIKQSLSNDKNLSQPPGYLEGLIERAQKGYSVGMVSTFEDTFWGMGLFGAKFFDSQGLIAPQLEGWAKWLAWLRQANTQPNFILIRDRKILHNAFAQGSLAYYVCDSTEIVELKKVLKDDLQVAPLPKESDRRATPLLYSLVMMLNRYNSLDEKQSALELMKFMTNAEQQLQRIVQSQSFIPTNRSVIIDKDLLPKEAVLLRQEKTAIALPLDDLERLIPIFEEGELLFQKAIAGDIDSSEAAMLLTATINQQIDQKKGS